jgi:hypothetical protein
VFSIGEGLCASSSLFPVLLLFVRAHGICPRCTAACRLIVLP